MTEKTKLEIPTWEIVKIILVIIAFGLLFLIRDVVGLFFIVLILTATFSPVIKTWSKYIGRVLAIIALFLIFVFVVGTVVYFLIPPMVTQTTLLANNIPAYINTIDFESLHVYAPDIREFLQGISSNLGTISSNIFSFTAGIFSGIFTLVMIFVLTFYMLVDENNVKKFISSLFAPSHKENAIQVINKIANKVGSWFRGQIVLGLIIFIIDYIGLTIIGIPYALVLAIISGFLEIVPTVGPVISGIIAALVALTISPLAALMVIILYLVVQTLENTFIVPKVMQKAIGVSPVVIILAIIAGAKLLGVVGAIISIPIAASISVLIIEWPTISKMFSKE